MTLTDAQTGERIAIDPRAIERVEVVGGNTFVSLRDGKGRLVKESPERIRATLAASRDTTRPEAVDLSLR